MLKEVQKFTRNVPQLNPEGLRTLAKEINLQSKSKSSSNAPVLTDIDALEKEELPPPVQQSNRPEEPKGTGIDKYLEQATCLIGKTPVAELQRFIYRMSLPALSVGPKLDDFEELASTALDLAWTRSGGDWVKMLSTLDAELGESSRASDLAITACVEACNTLTEGELKALIIKMAPEGVNALPKLDKKKYEGKFLHCDYVAELIDLVRTQNNNDYVKVASILGKLKKQKKGFGV